MAVSLHYLVSDAKKVRDRAQRKDCADAIAPFLAPGAIERLGAAVDTVVTARARRDAVGRQVTEAVARRIAARETATDTIMQEVRPMARAVFERPAPETPDPAAAHAFTVDMEVPKSAGAIEAQARMIAEAAAQPAWAAAIASTPLAAVVARLADETRALDAATSGAGGLEADRQGEATALEEAVFTMKDLTAHVRKAANAGLRKKPGLLKLFKKAPRPATRKARAAGHAAAAARRAAEAAAGHAPEETKRRAKGHGKAAEAAEAGKVLHEHAVGPKAGAAEAAEAPAPPAKPSPAPETGAKAVAEGEKKN
jgi:hypothetical protein